MKSSFARFNHVCLNFGVESLEQSVKLDRVVIFISALAIPFSKHHFFQIEKPKSSAFYSVFIVRAVFQMLYCCCGGERRPTSNAGYCFARKLRRPRSAFDWLSVSFFAY